MYMQSGQYHSAGEVLAGLYNSALTLADDPNIGNFDVIAPNFKKMWEAFRDRPEDFYPLTDENKARLNEKSPQIIQELQKQHTAIIADRHDQRMEAEEAKRMRVQKSFQQENPKVFDKTNKPRAGEL
jgi:hypothetical protein